MEIKGISKEDLNGILFINFPDSEPLELSKEKLELMVYQCWERFCSDLNEDEKPELNLTPYWVNLALFEKSWKEAGKMSKERFKKCVTWARDYRVERNNNRRVNSICQMYK